MAWIWVRVVGLAVVATGIAFAGAAEEMQRPWWDDYPILVDTNDPDVAARHHATLVMSGCDADPGWGIYGQIATRVPGIRQRLKNAGYRVISYYETFGETYCFIAELGERGDAPWTPLEHQHWGWQGYAGGPIRWIGVHTYFDDEAFAQPYTRTHPTYGAPPATYPDRRVATGYDGPPEDPRNSRVFDAICAKDIYGELAITPSYNAAVNAVDPDTGEPVGPLDGLLEYDRGYSGLLLLQRDSACPMWIDYTRAAVRMGAEAGLNGIWSDNYSPWDSLGYPPVAHAFGDWSVAGFPAFVAQHFDEAQRAELGLTDLQAFDIRAYLRAKAVAWGGADAGTRDKAWRDPRWLEEPVWLAYLIYKRQRGTQALAAYDAAVHEAARDHQPDGFLVGGNDIPFYSLGWCRGTLDMVSTEMTPGWHMGAGSRGIQLPPVGRFAPTYHLAREHARARLVNVWFYMPEEYRGAGGVADVIHYEMLANHALPKFDPGNPRVSGNPQSNAAFGAFVEQARPVFGRRERKADVGVYYSSSSVMAQLTPGGFVDFDRQPHQFAAWGVGTLLTEMHVPFRFVPEWKLTAEDIAPLRILIIPNADIMDPDVVATVLRPWVEAGGKLITTGDSGVRLPESGNFAPRPEGSCLAAFAADALTFDANVGMDYYLADADARPGLLAQWRSSWERFTRDTTTFLDDLGAAPPTVGMQVYEDREAGRWFLDLNNYDIDLAADAVRPTDAIRVEATLPAWLTSREARVLSPDDPPAVTIEPIDGDRVAITLSSLHRYASVVIGDVAGL